MRAYVIESQDTRSGTEWGFTEVGSYELTEAEWFLRRMTNGWHSAGYNLRLVAVETDLVCYQLDEYVFPCPVNVANRGNLLVSDLALFMWYDIKRIPPIRE